MIWPFNLFYKSVNLPDAKTTVKITVQQDSKIGWPIYLIDGDKSELEFKTNKIEIKVDEITGKVTVYVESKMEENILMKNKLTL